MASDQLHSRIIFLMKCKNIFTQLHLAVDKISYLSEKIAQN